MARSHEIDCMGTVLFCFYLYITIPELICGNNSLVASKTQQSGVQLCTAEMPPSDKMSPECHPIETISKKPTYESYHRSV